MSVQTDVPAPTDVPRRRAADRTAVVARTLVITALAAVAVWLFAITPPTPVEGSVSGGERGVVADGDGDGDSLGQTRWLLEEDVDRGTLLVATTAAGA